MDYENIDFPTAIEMLAQHAGLEVPREEDPQAKGRAQQADSLYDILQAAARFYQAALRQHADRSRVIDYLRGRGLTGELARDFGIGFAPPGWDNLIRSLTADCKGAEATTRKLALMEQAGLIVSKEGKPGHYYDRFRERVMFPIRDARGRVIAFGGRVLGDEKPKYLNSPETPVFHKARELYGLFEARKRNRQLDYLLLVEGYMDVVSLFQYELTSAIATLGTASSPQHLDKIYRYTSLLVVCFDGDEAGRKAARRLMELALPSLKDGREVRFLFLESGEDPDTFVRKRGKEAFEQRVEQAMPLEQFLFDAEAQGLDLDSEAGKATYSSRLLPFIKQLPAGIYQQRLLAKLAEQLKLSADFLAQQMAQIKVVGQRQSTEYAGANAQAAASKAPKNAAQSTAPAGVSASEKASSGDVSAHPDSVATPQAVTEKTLVWAVRALLHYPALAIERDLPEELRKAQLPEAVLLCDVSDYISQRNKDTGRLPGTHALLGRWHDTEQEPLLLACIGSDHQVPETLELARSELLESLANWSNSQREKVAHEKLAGMSSKAPSELSEEEIARLRAYRSE